MRVLMFGWEFPPLISGGLGTACYGMTKHLSQLGTEIIFVLPKGRPDMEFFKNFQILGANEVELNESRSRLEEKISEQTMQFMSIDAVLSPYMDEDQYMNEMKRMNPDISDPEGAVGRLDFTGDYGATLLDEVTRYSLIASQIAMSEEFDLIHAHDWMTFLAGCEAKKVSGKPLVCHIHATEYDRAGRKPSDNIMAMEKHGLERADLVIAVSHRTKKVLVRNYGIDEDKIRVVHNAVNKERSLPKSLPDPARVLGMRKEKKGGKVVLFLGRVTMQKGPDYFVEAARMVLEQMDNVHFVMAGGGDLLPRMIERVAAERLHDRFHFTGFLDRERVEMMYAMSDLYVMPSVSEPFGITPFEAMVYEVPIIVSRQSGITEVLQHAVKVDFWDVHELASSIVNILKDEKLAKHLAREGAKELDRISWGTAARQIMDIYRELLDQ